MEKCHKFRVAFVRGIPDLILHKKQLNFDRKNQSIAGKKVKNSERKTFISYKYLEFYVKIAPCED